MSDTELMVLIAILCLATIASTLNKHFMIAMCAVSFIGLFVAGAIRSETIGHDMTATFLLISAFAYPTLLIVLNRGWAQAKDGLW